MIALFLCSTFIVLRNIPYTALQEKQKLQQILDCITIVFIMAQDCHISDFTLCHGKIGFFSFYNLLGSTSARPPCIKTTSPIRP